MGWPPAAAADQPVPVRKVRYVSVAHRAVDASARRRDSGAVPSDAPRHDPGRPDRRDGRPPEPWQVQPDQAPATVAAWQARVENLLTNQCCPFHRNMEISSRYAWMYDRQPLGFKWTAMAAFASHHVRLALFPLRLDADGSGYVDLPRSLARRKFLLTPDVHTIRATNNAIFDDIFWVHLAYSTAEDGIGRLRTLLAAEPRYAPVLAGFESIDRGCRVLADRAASAADRRRADEQVWAGTVQLLEHEQRALVQPNFDQLSCAFARLVSIAATTSFEVRGLRQEVACFTSFYLHSLRRGVPHPRQVHAWPRITHFEDRWRWLETSVVPRFRRLEAAPGSIRAALRRISAEARVYASIPCVPPG